MWLPSSCSRQISDDRDGPPGWYIIRPRRSGPRGESISSPLACSIFHDTSFQVYMSEEARRQGVITKWFEERFFGFAFTTLKFPSTLILKPDHTSPRMQATQSLDPRARDRNGKR